MTANPKMVERQNLDKETVKQINKLHDFDLEIREAMDSICDFNDAIRDLAVQWNLNQFALQILWGFACDARRHEDFTLPKCSCPYFDNMELLGTDMRYVNGDCIIHGFKQKVFSA